MTCAKDCIDELEKHGIDGKADPYLQSITTACAHFLPFEEIASQILLMVNMANLTVMLPGGDVLSPDEQKKAVKLLREGKTLAEIFKALRPGVAPSVKI